MALALQGLALILLTLALIPLVSGGLGIMFLGALGAALGAAWLIRKPHWGVLTILVLMFVELKVLFGITYLVSAVLLIPLAWSILRDRGVWLLRVPHIQILLLIGFIFVISTLWSEFKYSVTLFPDKDQTVKQTIEFITHLGWLVFFVYFINTRQKIELTAMLTVVLISSAAITAVFLFVATGAADRAAANFSLAKNSNRLAFISVFATSLVWFYRSYAETRRWSLLSAPLLVILPLAALASGSRGGLLQLGTLAALIIKDQKGWSPGKRILLVCVMGFVALSLVAVVPSTYIERAMTYDPGADAPGQESLQNRVRVILSALSMVASDPIFGAGFGNFPWVARAFFGSSGATHNSYLWAFTSGGIGAFTLYLLLFYLIYRTLKQLERGGSPELLWLVKATKVNLVLFLICSISTDFWLSDFLYLILGFTIAMAHLEGRQKENLAALRRPTSFIRVGSHRLAEGSQA